MRYKTLSLTFYYDNRAQGRLLINLLSAADITGSICVPYVDLREAYGILILQKHCGYTKAESKVIRGR